MYVQSFIILIKITKRFVIWKSQATSVFLDFPVMEKQSLCKNNRMSIILSVLIILMTVQKVIF